MQTTTALCAALLLLCGFTPTAHTFKSASDYFQTISCTNDTLETKIASTKRHQPYILTIFYCPLPVKNYSVVFEELNTNVSGVNLLAMNFKEPWPEFRFDHFSGLSLQRLSLNIANTKFGLGNYIGEIGSPKIVKMPGNFDLSSGSDVRINCVNNSWDGQSGFRILMDTKPLRFKKVTIDACPLPKDSYASEFQALNINASAVTELLIINLQPNLKLLEKHLHGLHLQKLSILSSPSIFTDETLLTPLSTTLKRIEILQSVLPPLPLSTIVEEASLHDGRSTGEWGGCHHLKRLLMSTWQLSKLQNGFLAHCPQLTELELSNLSLGIVIQVLNGTKSLTSLSIYKLNVHKLPEGLLNGLVKLEKLILSQNNLYAIDRDTFKFQSSLKELHLSDNCLLISQMKESLAPLRSLQYLFLTGNPLLQAYEERIVNCSYHRLFGAKLPPVKGIHLYNTKFSELCGSMSEELEPFHLDDSEIEGKEFIDLSYLSISRATTGTVNALLSNSLPRLKIANNPLICDCDNQHLIAALQINQNKVEDYHQITCRTGKKLEDVNPSELCEVTNQRLCIVIAIFLLMSFIGFLLILYLRRIRKNSKVYGIGNVSYSS